MCKNNVYLSNTFKTSINVFLENGEFVLVWFLVEVVLY
jgi:hypothetical protein